MAEIKIPYKYKGPLDPVEDEAVCASRKKDVNRVMKGVLSGDYWAVIGPRQVGKTTFLRLLEKAFPHAYYVYVNFEAFGTDNDQFYRSIINEIQTRIPSHDSFDTNQQWAQYGPELTFLHFLDNFRPIDESRKVILFFDEIGKISSIGNFLHLWRKVYHERYYKSGLNRYAVILSGSADLIPLTKGANSPFNIAEILYVGDLSRDDSMNLIDAPLKKLDIRIEKKAKEALWSQTKGHPQILQHLCYILAEKALAGKRTIKNDDIEPAIQSLYCLNSALDTLKQHININNILEELLQDLLNGEKKYYYSNKEYAVAGAGAIVEKNCYCAIRNPLYEKYIKGVLKDKKKNALSPVGQRLLKLQEKVRDDLTKLKDNEEILRYTHDSFQEKKCEIELNLLEDSEKKYRKELEKLSKRAGRNYKELIGSITNLLQKITHLKTELVKLFSHKGSKKALLI